MNNEQVILEVLKIVGVMQKQNEIILQKLEEYGKELSHLRSITMNLDGMEEKLESLPRTKQVLDDLYNRVVKK